MQTFNMGQVPPVTFGAGRISKVPKIVKALNDGPVFIIADAILAQLGVTDESDMEARRRVLWASTVAGLALHNCNTHMGHNISHALGSLVCIHHGLATGLGLEVSLPWLVARPEGAENYGLAAQALGGAAQPAALPAALSELMRACHIPAALPVECVEISPEALAHEMKNEANIGMSKNAACQITESDLDEMSILMMRLRKTLSV